MKSKEEEDKDQEFNYQNRSVKNPEQQLQQPLQQPQQLPPPPPPLPSLPPPLLLPPPPLIAPMVYAPIAKIEKFTNEEDNAQMWLNNVKKAIAINR
ncbi:hypothetical protein G9A89_003597 [Geosiphon pyriformis]|nr:hypothetical protein G9A89_003597 [Geosiphon pyriformis]